MDKRPLHICIVTAEFPGLTETFITNKVLELSNRGHRITVVKNSSSAAVNASHVALVKQANIEVLSLQLPTSIRGFLKSIINQPRTFIQAASLSRKGFKNKFKAQLQLQLLTNHPYDIIHFEFSGLAVSYLQAITKLRAKTVVSCRGTAEKVKPLTNIKRRESLSNLFSLVSAIHCVSKDMANTVQMLGANAKKLFVNTPAIDASVFHRTKEYANNEDILRILTIGRFTFQKGFLIGLMAMKELQERGVPFKWLIVGDGPLAEEIVYHIDALGLQNNVELLGKKNRDEVLELYNNVDVFLLPSLYEGIANVCLEAMAMQLPVVSTKSGGMEEVIQHHENGLLCNVYNPGDIAEKLQFVANDFTLRKQLGINASKTILNNFTLKKQIDVFEEQYYLLLNN